MHRPQRLGFEVFYYREQGNKKAEKHSRRGAWTEGGIKDFCVTRILLRGGGGMVGPASISGAALP